MRKLGYVWEGVMTNNGFNDGYKKRKTRERMIITNEEERLMDKFEAVFLDKIEERLLDKFKKGYDDGYGNGFDHGYNMALEHLGDAAEKIQSLLDEIKGIAKKKQRKPSWYRGLDDD